MTANDLLAAGEDHACAITTTGAASCWGQGSQGRLGNGGFDDQSVPAPVSSVPSFNSLEADTAHTCGIAVGGTAWCWGDGYLGRLGDGSSQDQNVPVQVNQSSGLDEASNISAGDRSSCATRRAVAAANRTAWCWGEGDDGRLGNGSTATSPRRSR